MKTKSKRFITIETNRTVMVRKTSVRAQEWNSAPYNSAADDDSNTKQSSTSPDAWISGLQFEHPDYASQRVTEELTARTNFWSPDLARDGAEVPEVLTRNTVSAKRPGAQGQNNLNDLFDWLGENRELAGIRYEEIRRALIKIFVCRGAHISEDLADQTIDRVVRKLPEIRDTYQGRPIDYFCGVAKKIYLEYSRKNIPPAITPVPAVQVDEEEFNRLERCLNKLTAMDRTLILEYYGGERKQKIDGRKQLADKLGIPINALRIRAHRIRTQLMAMMLADAKNRQNLEM